MFILFAYNMDMRNFIYITKLLGMLNGDYAFVTVSMTLDSDYWKAAGEVFGITIADVNGQFTITFEFGPITMLMICHVTCSKPIESNVSNAYFYDRLDGPDTTLSSKAIYFPRQGF